MHSRSDQFPLQTHPLDLSNNWLSGSSNIFRTIPKEIGKLKSLMDLELSEESAQRFNPNIPRSAHKLTTLYLYSNNLSGTIPKEIGKLEISFGPKIVF
ncbi:hypothetical protein DVH24_014709 [Malus domestica]|uniref:Uncharacterized protein n=1 Tax=Malus domestica TaxID=3750 RepID=A0A498J663_MALDO|nr:hypothetical protein DVH24_014709 [Malus domestica]